MTGPLAPLAPGSRVTLSITTRRLKLGELQTYGGFGNAPLEALAAFQGSTFLGFR